jgi:tetratricopeptide (TPR) repeat protein
MTRFLVLFLAALVLGSCSFLNRGPQSSPSDADPGASSPVPMFTDARQALDEGNRLLDINETEKAIEAFDQAVALDPDLAEAYFQLGIAHSLIENERKASAAPGENAESEEGKKGKPESVRAFEKAVEAYRRLIDKNPDDDVSYFNLGRALSKLNKDEDAEKALEKAIKLKPDDVEYLTQLGSIRIKLAKYRDAVDPLEKALQLDPENSEAQELFDDAEAGRRRVEYTPPKANANSKTNSNSAANTGSNTATNTSNSINSNIRVDANRRAPGNPPANKPSNRP